MSTEQAIAGQKKMDVTQTPVAAVGTSVQPKFTPAQQADIENRFTYHPPKGDQPQRYEALRTKAKELAMLIIETVPASREQSLALTYLEHVCFNANAGIARNG